MLKTILKSGFPKIRAPIINTPKLQPIREQQKLRVINKTYNISHNDNGKSFNNSIIFYKNRLLMVYRHAFGRAGADYSEIYMSELDELFNIKSKKLLLKHAEDGRLCILNNDLYMSYSSYKRRSWHAHMHICKLNDNLDIVFDKHLDPSQRVEKNWQFFTLQNNIYCIYDCNPFTIFKFDNNFGVIKIIRKDIRLGVRGNTPPILFNNRFMMLTHARSRRKVYYNKLLTFDTNFNIISLKSINIDDFRITYPCGFVRYMDKFLVSYGIDDRDCKVKEVQNVEVND